jgi:hypothetical protein
MRKCICSKYTHKSDKEGMLSIDIILAFALATIFVAVASASYASAREIYQRAIDMQAVLNDYAASNGALQNKPSIPYGNDRVEYTSSTTGLIEIGSVADGRTIDSVDVTSSLCSVDFFDQSAVGAYASTYRSQAGAPHASASSISIESIPLPIDPRISLTDLEVRGDIAYVSSDSTTRSDPDMMVFDVADSAHPRLLSSIDTGPGIAAFALAGNRIYAAAASTNAQLHIIRIDALNSLGLESKYRLPLPNASTSPARGTAVAFRAGIVYLGTDKWDGNELTLIDASNPVAPDRISGFETGSKISDILISGSTAYVADADQYQLRSIDVSDSSRPILSGYASPPGWSRQEGVTVSSFEYMLDFARTSGGFDITTDPELISFEKTSSAGLSPSLTWSRQFNIPGGVYGAIRDRHHLYAATRQYDEEFQVFDPASSATSSAMSFALPVAPERLRCDADHLYVLAGTAPVIYRVSFN